MEEILTIRDYEKLTLDVSYDFYYSLKLSFKKKESSDFRIKIVPLTGLLGSYGLVFTGLILCTFLYTEKYHNLKIFANHIERHNSTRDVVVGTRGSEQT